jgi:cell division protease FtsH
MGRSGRNYSESTAQSIDAEVRRLCDDAYARATDLLVKNREKLELIAKALLEYETLSADQVRELIDTGNISNPPTPPRPPSEPPPLKVRTESSVSEPVGELPPGLSGAPA